MEYHRWAKEYQVGIAMIKALNQSQLERQNKLEILTDESFKTLGVRWESARDELCFNFASVHGHESPTKRSILPMVSKHFDPLGIAAPVTINARMVALTAQYMENVRKSRF